MAENNGISAFRNEVKIAGQVVNVFKVPGKDILNVRVKITTGAKLNHPNISWYGENSKMAADTLKGKNRPNVSITAYVQTTRSISNGKTEYHQNIVGKTLTVDDVAKSENEVHITGELERKYKLVKKSTGEHQGTKIRVKTCTPKTNYPEITLFKEQNAAVQSIDLGSTVSVIGTVQTGKSIDPATGETLHYEGIIGLKIDV